MWWFIVDAETNAMQTMMHSSMVYSAPSLVGSATLLLGLVRHGGWRWRAGGPMRFIVEEVVDRHTYRTTTAGRARREEGRRSGSRVESVSFPLKVV